MENQQNSPLDVVKGREQEIGPPLGIFIIIILLIIGAFYFWNNELNKNSKNGTSATTTEIIIYEPVKTATSTNPSTSTVELE